MKLKKLLNYINSMSTPAYLMLKISLIVSIMIMTAALVMLLKADGQGVRSLTYLLIAQELFAMPQSILLIGGIFSAVIEDKIS